MVRPAPERRGQRPRVLRCAPPAQPAPQRPPSPQSRARWARRPGGVRPIRSERRERWPPTQLDNLRRHPARSPPRLRSRCRLAQRPLAPRARPAAAGSAPGCIADAFSALRQPRYGRLQAIASFQCRQRHALCPGERIRNLLEPFGGGALFDRPLCGEPLDHELLFTANAVNGISSPVFVDCLAKRAPVPLATCAAPLPCASPPSVVGPTHMRKRDGTPFALRYSLARGL